MEEKKEKTLNLQLILPAILLTVELIAVALLVINGYEIASFLIYFFLFIAMFLVYQVSRQIAQMRMSKQALSALQAAETFINANAPMEAIKKWKTILLRLPKDLFLSTLSKMKNTYETENMLAAVAQVRDILNESNKFFEMTENLKQISMLSSREWQAKVFKLRDMINALPVNKEQSPTDGHAEL